MNGNLAYQDDSWDEMIEGKIILMSPRPTINHNRIADNITRIFGNYLENRTCEVFGDGTDLYLTEQNRFVPDCMVICDKDKIQYDGVHGAPDLIVEVLSPSTAKKDRGKKMAAYAAAGVKEYWIVSPSERSVEVYLLDDGRYALHEIYTLYPDYVLGKMTEEEREEVATEFRCSLFDDLVIRLEDVFKRVS